MELVRISTAGSVDDGKSTLIGRLLYDHGALTIEQEELVQRKTREKGWENLDLSVLTDGLTAEREQGITIDVAHMYFATNDRKFIVSDSPGHIEYTRNMVTGASGSDVSIILVDVRKGLLEQSFRHFYISHLLRVPRIVFCVNKMDLVAYSEDRFLEVAVVIKEMVARLGEAATYAIVPISSLKGDNVVERSEQMSWYTGKTLDEWLQGADATSKTPAAFRFDVQQVIRAQTNEFTDYRAFAGRVVSGAFSVGDRVRILPGGTESTVKEIRRFTDVLTETRAGDSVAISLVDEVDASRGALFVPVSAEPALKNELTAKIVWMNEHAATPGHRFLLRAGSRDVLARLMSIKNQIDPVRPEAVQAANELTLNAIAEVVLKTAQPVYLDAYREVAGNGVFILIDEQTNATVAVGFAE